MPLVRVYGFEDFPCHATSRTKANKLIREAVAQEKDLGITPEQVTIAHPCRTDEYEGIIVIIEGLFVRPERTKEVKQKTCQNVKDALVEYMGNSTELLSFIEVWTEPLRVESEGFVNWKRERK